MSLAQPRAAAREFATTDPERAHAFLRHTYADNAMRITGGRDGFRMAHTQEEAGPLSVAVLSHSMAVEHVTEPLGRLVLARVVHGHIERRTGGETLRAAQGDVFLVSTPEAPYVVRWDDISLQLVSLDPAVLASVVGSTAETPASESTGPPDVRFTGCAPVTANAARYCGGVLDLLTGHLLTGSARAATAAAEPLVLDSAARSLGAALLTTFPNTAVSGPKGPRTAGARTGASEAAVRRAVAYMEEHAHEPVGLGEMARAARTTPRALQRAFRDHLDTTPTAHLRRLRLERAYRELTAADPTDPAAPSEGVTVAAVARRWGFAHPGRFAAACRATYGRTPQEVLRG